MRNVSLLVYVSVVSLTAPAKLTTTSCTFRMLLWLQTTPEGCVLTGHVVTTLSLLYRTLAARTLFASLGNQSLRSSILRR